MAFNINSFRSQLGFDGARPNLFEIIMTPPAEAGGLFATEKLAFMCKAAQIPGTTINSVDVPYFGRQVKVAGNRTYDNWTITVINDEDFATRRVFENWHNMVLNRPISNVRSRRGTNTYEYGVDALVLHYGKEGDVIRSYQMVGMWPTEVAPIDLAWDTNDTIEEFTVTFAYQYWMTPETSAAEGDYSGLLRTGVGAIVGGL